MFSGFSIRLSLRFQFVAPILFFSLLLAMMLATILTRPVKAGGWTVTTLDAFPDIVVSGEPVEVSFMIRQHGRTPWIFDAVQVHAWNPATGDSFIVTAQQEGEPGHYRAELIFPESGRWEWGVASGLMPEIQRMPDMSVGELPVIANSGADQWMNFPPISIAGFLTAGGIFAGAVVLFARRLSRLAVLAAAAGLLVVFAALFFSYQTNAQAAAQADMQPFVEHGKQLFIAKGCVVCHVNANAGDEYRSMSIDYGPNLTQYTNDPGYLTLFLSNPADMRPGIAMPDLDLQENEIEALVAFINNKDKK